MRVIAVTRDLGGDERRQRVVEHLEQKFETVRVVPRLPPLIRILNLVHSFNVRKDTWREQSKKNVFFFRAMSKAIRKSILTVRRGSSDVVMTFEALFAPGCGEDVIKPFVMYEDGTSRMTLQRWPDWVPATARTPAYRQVEEETYKSADHVFTTSRWVQESLVRDYGVPPERVSSVGQGHDFSPPPSLSACTGPIIFVGYEFDRKGGPQLLEAFRQVRAVYPDAKLDLVGPELRVSIPGVTVHGKISDKQRLQSLLHGAGIFVLPSLFDPNPHAAMEAMAMGLPVVTTDGCGTQEIIQDGISGYVVPAGDVAALANRLLLLLRDPQLRLRVGHTGARRVNETSNWPDVANRIAGRLESLRPGQ